MSEALATKRAKLLAERDLIDANGGGALWLLTGTMAAQTEDPPLQAPLAIIVLPVPSFALDPVAAVMTLAAQGNVAVSGQPTWARFVDGAGNPVRDVTAGPPGSGAQAIVTDGKTPPSAMLYVGGEANVTAAFGYA